MRSGVGAEKTCAETSSPAGLSLTVINLHAGVPAAHPRRAIQRQREVVRKRLWLWFLDRQCSGGSFNPSVFAKNYPRVLSAAVAKLCFAEV